MTHLPFFALDFDHTGRTFREKQHSPNVAQQCDYPIGRTFLDADFLSSLADF
jgi:hypothetical protein